MITFKQLIESTNTDPIDLSFLKSKFTSYSHGPTHNGFIDKSGLANVSHKDLHDKIKNTGYRYVYKRPDIVGGVNTTYHVYEKSGGHSIDHTVTVTTRGGKVWTVEQKTNKDNS